MIAKYFIILLVTSVTIPVFADNPSKTDCSGGWTIYQAMLCNIDNIRDFVIHSMDKQDIIIAQNSQIEKLLIQQNKLQAYTFCGMGINMDMPSKYLNTFDDCVKQVMEETK